MTRSATSRRISSSGISGSCCVEMTTASTRMGRSPSYSTVTCDLPSGRRYGMSPFLRTAARWRVRLCASTIGSGISSSRLAAGVAEHHALIAGAEQLERIVVAALGLHRTIDAHRDVRRLLVDRDADAAGLGVEADRRARVADLAHDLADDVRNIDVGLGRDLAGDVNLAGDRERFDATRAVRIVFEDRVEHRVGDLIGELVGMPFGHRLAGEEPRYATLRSLAPRRNVLHLLGGQRVDLDAHRRQLELRDFFVDLDRERRRPSSRASS